MPGYFFNMNCGVVSAGVRFNDFQAEFKGWDHDAGEGTNLDKYIRYFGCAVGLHRSINDVENLGGDGHFMHRTNHLHLLLNQQNEEMYPNHSLARIIHYAKLITAITA